MKKVLSIMIISVLMLGILPIASGCSARVSPAVPSASLTKFQSPEEFVSAFHNGQGGYYGRSDSLAAMPNSLRSAEAGSSKAPDHSITNVQVEGVDEADVVKTDGDFIYVISGESVFILVSYPPEDMQIASRIQLEENARPSELFIQKDRLVVIGLSYSSGQNDSDEHPEHWTGQLVFVKIFDISDRRNPRLLKTVEYEGSYDTSRMIDENIYMVITSYPYYVDYEKGNIQPSEIIPPYRTVVGNAAPGAFKPACDWSQLECLDPERCSSFLSILSMSLGDNGSSLQKRVIAGNSDNVYASSENLYASTTNYEYDLYPYESETDDVIHTTIHKFRLNGNAVEYLASADVPGTVLNQFSMDESKGYFRIATTVGHVTREGSGSTNNVYILDPALNIVGSLEGLAKGETMHSARFMGDRAYLVTFKKVDPFFVLDLSDPKKPLVLGALKIPGYSDYLHPYDETHIIGVGKNTIEADPGEGNFAWYQGIKIALFDVSDFSNPKEMYKVEIGDRGTDSSALRDHKAFLFDRDKNLMVLPIMLAELTPEQKASGDTKAYDYGKPTFQGAYVYDISLAGGISLKGRITHSDNAREFANGSYYYGYYGTGNYVERSLYIGNSLYTISPSKIKANDLDSLEEQASVDLEQ